MSKVYSIGTKQSECYGHGDYGSETCIRPSGFYGSGGLPPVFRSKSSAQKYLDEIKYNGGKCVVELEFIES